MAGTTNKWTITLAFVGGVIVGYLIHEFYNTPPIDTIVLNGSDYNVAIPTDTSEYDLLLPKGPPDQISSSTTYKITNSGQTGGHDLHIKPEVGIMLMNSNGTPATPAIDLHPGQSARFNYLPTASPPQWRQVP